MKRSIDFESIYLYNFTFLYNSDKKKSKSPCLDYRWWFDTSFVIYCRWKKGKKPKRSKKYIKIRKIEATEILVNLPDCVIIHKHSKIVPNTKGSRLLKRVTEYVYAPIFNTPFSIILASPNSFGHYFIKAIDQPEFYDNRVKGLFYSDVKTLIQLLNCTYKFYDFVKKTTIKIDRFDSCITEVLSFPDHILAIKLDLVLNEHIYESTEDIVFVQYPDAIKSLFYGSYSGVTFHQAVKYLDDIIINLDDGEKSLLSFEQKYYLRTIEFSDYLR